MSDNTILDGSGKSGYFSIAKDNPEIGRNEIIVSTVDDEYINICIKDNGEQVTLEKMYPSDITLLIDQLIGLYHAKFN